jgi:hypothetical protein
MRSAWSLFCLLVLSAALHAEERGPAAPLFSSGLPQNHALDYSFRYVPGQGGGGAADPILADHRGRAFWVLHRNEKEAWTFQQSASHLNLSESPVVAQTGLVIPSSLWDLETGVGYKRLLSKDRQWGATASVGSASDKPFYGWREMVIRLVGLYRIPSGLENAWLLLAHYSNNRGFLNHVPIPGVAYMWARKANGFSAVAGFPFAAVDWRPNLAWSARASMFGPRTFSAEAARRVVGPARIYAGFDWTQASWLRVARDDASNRVVYDAQRATLGLRGPVLGGISMDLSGGREFSRRFFENHSTSARDVATADLPDSWFMTFQLRWRG